MKFKSNESSVPEVTGNWGLTGSTGSIGGDPYPYYLEAIRQSAAVGGSPDQTLALKSNSKRTAFQNVLLKVFSTGLMGSQMKVAQELSQIFADLAFRGLVSQGATSYSQRQFNPDDIKRDALEREIQAIRLYLGEKEEKVRVWAHGVDALPLRDPMEPVSAAQLAQKLGVSEDTVRSRERKSELFSVMKSGRKRGREYPAFQSWPEITVHDLRPILELPGLNTGPEAYLFFSATNPDLAGLTPVEILAGKVLGSRSWVQSDDELGRSALEILGKSKDDRFNAVRAAATAFAADSQQG